MGYDPTNRMLKTVYSLTRPPQRTVHTHPYPPIALQSISRDAQFPELWSQRARYGGCVDSIHDVLEADQNVRGLGRNK